MNERLTYVEIDVPYCALRYGETTGAGTCPAVLGVDSEVKCYNTRNTCPVIESFDTEIVTLRFAKDTGYLPRDIDAIPSIQDVSFSPATLSLGEGLGIRAKLEVTFIDHPSPDTHPAGDKYIADRDYDPFKQGTFWGKWRARSPWLRGQSIRLIRGMLGQALGDMETRHYVIESTDGPNADGSFSIVAHDPLIMLLGDRALAPRPSNGFLVGDINASVTTATLSPSGIGNLEYPASGHVCIGGNEVCSFTRSGDTLTLTRGSLGSIARTHQAEERVQLVLRYNGDDPADIIAHLMQTFGGVDPAWIPLANWQLETDTYLKRVYGAVIVEPTPVKQLVAELVEQAALAVWWDDIAAQIRLMVLRNVPPDAQALDPDLHMLNTLSMQEQPEKRVSQAWTYYGLRDPTQPLSNKDNYQSSLLTVDLQSEANYGGPAIKEILARWIPAFGRSTANRVNSLQIGRYKNPPRKFSLGLFPLATPQFLAPGMNFRVAGLPIQDAAGAPLSAPAIVTRLGTEDTRYSLELEEAFFAEIEPADLFNRVIVVDGNTLNINLRTLHDSIFPVISDPYGITLTCIIAAGVIVGSNSTALPAFDVGSWVPGLPIHIDNRGRIQGRGGNGWAAKQNATWVWQAATNGGPALYTRYPITLKNNQCWGGGGGGGAGFRRIESNGSVAQYTGGGGGAGFPGGLAGFITADNANDPNSPTAVGQPGSPEAGGDGSPSAWPSSGGMAPPYARGGHPGQDGISAFESTQTSAGRSIDGVSYVTPISGNGDRRGPQVN